MPFTVTAVAPVTSPGHPLRRRAVVGVLTDVALALTLVLLFPFVLFLLGAPFVLLGHAAAALFRLL